MMKKKVKKSLPSSKLIIILVCAALVGVGIILLFFSLFAIYKVYAVDMSITVSNVSAFNTDTDALSFGRATPGSSNTRVMVMSHDYSKPLLVHFKKSGNISRFVETPEDFYLEPGFSKEVSVTAKMPEGSPMATYEGQLKVYFRRI